MDIMVKGTASTYYRPEQVVLNLTFTASDAVYETTLEKGTQAVTDFISNVIQKIGEDKENLKTQGYRIQELCRLNNNRRVLDKYSFNQNAKIKFDYDIKKMAAFIELTATLGNAPSYTIGFEVKDEETYKNMVLGEAINKAKEKAGIIATALGMKLVRCLKTDFKPFDSSLSSASQINSMDFRLNETGGGVADGSPAFFSSSSPVAGVSENIQTTFTPEDIRVTESVFCLWQAE